jgi:hypothetical protein
MQRSNQPFLDATIKTAVTMTFICVFYYSFLPFLYIINVLPIDKNVLFVGIVSVSLLVGMFYFVLSGGVIDRKVINSFGLYGLFSTYSLMSFALTPNYLDDTFTIRTLAIINPIVIILSILCRNEKQFLLRLLYMASLVYYLFAIYSLLSGRIEVSGNVFQDIFGLTEISPYRNINLYLGMFAVIGLVKAKQQIMLLRKCFAYVFSSSALGLMFVIGGRTELFAAVVAVITLLIAEYKRNSLAYKFKTLIFLLLLALLLVVFHSYVINVFMSTFAGWRIQMLFEGGDASERLFLFSSAIDLFLLNVRNVFVGAGINYFPVYIGAYSTGMSPHSTILELLSEYGMAGTSLFLLPIAYILLIRKCKLGTIYGRSVTERLVFVLVIYFWIALMLAGALRSSWVLIFFTYLLIPARPKVTPRF